MKGSLIWVVFVKMLVMVFLGIFGSFLFGKMRFMRSFKIMKVNKLSFIIGKNIR